MHDEVDLENEINDFISLKISENEDNTAINVLSTDYQSNWINEEKFAWKRWFQYRRYLLQKGRMPFNSFASRYIISYYFSREGTIFQIHKKALFIHLNPLQFIDKLKISYKDVAVLWYSNGY
jgi:hypothetical protein